MNRHTKTKTVVWLVFILALAVGCGPGYIKKTEQFATRVKSVVNPDELQNWATNLIAKTPIIDHKTPVDVKGADIPKYVRAIYEEYPPDVYVVRNTVEIWYGSGFGHWGLYVGSPTLRLESSDTHYIVQWKPGVYFWSGP